MITDKNHTSISPLDRVLDLLPDAKRKNGYYMARCPAHEDKEPSLSISQGNKGVVLTCHAGCDTALILEEIGLDYPDLFEDDLYSGNGHKKPTATEKHEWTIKDPDGNAAAIHHRLDLDNGEKRVWWTRPDGSKGLGGIRTSELPLYGSERVKDYPEDVPIIVCEGEKATDALLAVGIPALGTVTGASSTPGAEPLEVLRGKRAILWPDADDAGRAHMERIAAKLQGVASEVRMYGWEDQEDAPKEGADAADHPAVKAGATDYVRAMLEEALIWEPQSANSDPAHEGHSRSHSLSRLGTGNDPKRSIRAVSFRGRAKPDPRRWVVDRAVPEGYATSWYGEGGIAKSLLVEHLGLSVAASGIETWAGLAIETVPVIFGDFELDETEHLRRAQQLVAGMGLAEMPSDFYYLPLSGVPIKEAFGIAAEECKQLGAGLFIVDSVGFALEGDAELAKDVLGFCRDCIQPIKDAGGVPLLIDHQAKVVKGEKYSDKQAFGSVYKTNFVRSSFQMRGSWGGNELTSTFTHKKSNFGPKLEDFSLRVTFEKDLITVERLAEALESPDQGPTKKQQVFKALERLGGATAERVTEETGINIKTVRNAINEMLNEDPPALRDTGEKVGRSRIVIPAFPTYLGNGNGNDDGLFEGFPEPVLAGGAA